MPIQRLQGDFYLFGAFLVFIYKKIKKEESIMKTFIVSPVSIVLMSVLLCPMAMAVPSMPDDVQMVQPDPSLPKELSAFFGKWQGLSGKEEFFVIVVKIDKEKANLYVWRTGNPRMGSPGWQRVKAEVIEDRGKYKLRFRGREATSEFTLRGEQLDWTAPPSFSVALKRVP